MPEINTTYVGRLEYREEDVLQFPAGLPGFEQECDFLPIDLPSIRPMILFQSLKTPELCFMTLPVFVVDPNYKLEMTPEDLKLLGLPEGEQPRAGTDVLCTGIIAVAENHAPTINLLAPLVVNPVTHRGVQAIQASSNYSHQHDLPVPEPEVACS